MERPARERSPEGDPTRDPDEVREGSEPRPGEGSAEGQKEEPKQGPCWVGFACSGKLGWGQGASLWCWQDVRLVWTEHQILQAC